MTERGGERAPERTYILSERQFIDAVLKGAVAIGVLPDGPLELERARVHRADNGGLVIHLWLPAATSPEVAYEPKTLQPLLRQYEAELPGPVPTLAEVQAWTQEQLLEVSAWVRHVHAWAHPITGNEPEPLDYDPPAVLLTVRGAPSQPTRVQKKRAARKKRTAAEKGSLADQHSHEVAAREAEEAQGE